MQILISITVFSGLCFNRDKEAEELNERKTGIGKQNS